MKRILIVTLVSGFLLSFGLQDVSGLTVSSVGGSWSNVVGGNNILYRNRTVLYGNGLEEQVRWGIKTTGGTKSGLGFTGIETPVTFGIDDVFQIGRLRYINQQTYGSPVESVVFSLVLGFSDPTVSPVTLDYTFGVNETPNLFGDVPDSVYLNELYPPQTFAIGHEVCTVQLLGFGRKQSNLSNQFVMAEDCAGNTFLWGKVVSLHTNPAPSAIIMGSLGIGVVGWLRRRGTL